MLYRLYKILDTVVLLHFIDKKEKKQTNYRTCVEYCMFEQNIIFHADISIDCLIVKMDVYKQV